MLSWAPKIITDSICDAYYEPVNVVSADHSLFAVLGCDYGQGRWLECELHAQICLAIESQYRPESEVCPDCCN